MAQLHEGSAWMVNDDAHRLHETGLNLEVDAGAYEQAHATFADAIQVLDGAPGTDAELQRARIIRDDGFTSVRQALPEGDRGTRQELFEAAQARLEESRTMTQNLFPTNRGESRRSRELFSEHGATLGTLARMVVAQQVMASDLPVGRDVRSQRDDIRQQQRYFGKFEAHNYLRQGSNMYYLVSNAMHAARAERLNGSPLHMLPWFGRVAVGLARTVAHDRGNMWATAKAVARIGVSIRSKQAAIASIKHRP